MSVAAIRDLEQGRRLRPRPYSIGRLTRALGLDSRQVEELTLAVPEKAAAPAAAPGLDRAGSDAGLWLQIFGPVTAWRDGVWVDLGPPRQRATLALLALDFDALVHRETIIDALWAEQPPATAVNLVHTYVSRLRKALDPDRASRDRGGLIASAGAGYRLRADASLLDLAEFRHIADAARVAGSSGDAVTSCQLYEEALRFCREQPLADLDLLRGHVAVAGVIRRWATTVLEYAEVAPAAGWHDRVLPHLRTLTAREPLDEKAHAHLIVVLAGNGHQAAALQVYEDVRARLDDQLGILPSADLTSAYLRVLRQDVIARPGMYMAPGARIAVPSHSFRSLRPPAVAAQYPERRRGRVDPPDTRGRTRPGTGLRRVLCRCSGCSLCGARRGSSEIDRSIMSCPQVLVRPARGRS